MRGLMLKLLSLLMSFASLSWGWGKSSRTTAPAAYEEVADGDHSYLQGDHPGKTAAVILAGPPSWPSDQAAAAATLAAAADGCDASDAVLTRRKETICASIGTDCGAANITAETDWPNQAVYMGELLAALLDPATCVSTAVAKEVWAWLDATDADPARFCWTWREFQVQYYDMPRAPGDRIESPQTLGRKCWAFAYLAQLWPSARPALGARAAEAGLGVGNFTAAYDDAVPRTMKLCDAVMANCFVNATFDAARNGTCPGKVAAFYAGFERENSKKRGDPPKRFSVGYPFPW